MRQSIDRGLGQTFEQIAGYLSLQADPAGGKFADEVGRLHEPAAIMNCSRHEILERRPELCVYERGGPVIVGLILGLLAARSEGES